MRLHMVLCRVLLLAWLWYTVRGEETVSCVLRETCVLPCRFDNAEKDVLLIEWYKEEGGGLVHALENSADMLQNQDEAFGGRTSMFPWEVSGGNASLQLSPLSVQDEGKYLCHVVRKSSEKDVWVTLRVEDPVDNVTLEWKGDVLVCSSEGMYPQPNISWTPHSEHQTHVKQIHNQLYSISSSLLLDLLPPQQFTCNISTYTSWKSATYSLRPSLEISKNIILPCVDSKVPEKSLKWTFKHKTIVTRNRAQVTCAGSWRPFVKSVSESGSLSLKELSQEQVGVYICELHTGDHTYISRTELRKTGTAAFSLAMIAIPVVLILIILTISTIIFVRRRKKKQDQQDEMLLDNVGGETNILHKMLHCIFEDLTKDQFEKFKDLLSNSSLMKDFIIIPKNELHKEEDVCKAMIKTYGIHCINVTKTILQNLKRNDLLEFMKGDLTDGDMSPTEYSALSFLLLSSDSTLEQFDLRKYYPTEKGLLALLLVIRVCTKAILSGCRLSSLSCTPLASVLRSSSLTHLDLSNNDLQDSGVERLCEGLKSASCKLETLNLSICGLSALGCSALALALRSSGLKLLDLSNNDLFDSGVELLCDGLNSHPCRLETLRLSGCLISERGGTSLARALSSTLSHLRELDLSYNHPGASAEHLTAVWDIRPPDSLRFNLYWHYRQNTIIATGSYACQFCLEPNTAHKNLRLSEDYRSVTYEWEEQPYPDHEDRFTHWEQVLSSSGLKGRRYWEVDCSGKRLKEAVSIAVSYKGIKRTGHRDCQFGMNNHSWSLSTWENHYIVRHDGTKIFLSYPFSLRVAVFLDSEAGVLSFYQVLSDEEQSHLHTFNTAFTEEEELFPGFEVGYNSKVTLVNMNS